MEKKKGVKKELFPIEGDSLLGRSEISSNLQNTEPDEGWV